jgi:hypothetical protein
MVFISTHFLNVFACENIYLWVNDSYTGIMYTMNENKSELRAIISYGVFHDVM